MTHTDLPTPLAGRPSSDASRDAGFTLLEVMIAVLIACGLLVVVLFYYHQAANLREALLKESSRITSVRLLLDRITAELRTAVPGSDLYPGLSGSSNELRFVRADMPIVHLGETDTNQVIQKPLNTVKIIQYRLSIAAASLSADTNVTNFAANSLERTETAWAPGGAPAAWEPAPATNSPADPADMADATNELGGWPANPVPAYTNLLAETGPETNAPVPAPRLNNTVARDICYVGFRFWAGTNWAGSWSSKELPAGVEVSIGFEPPAEETDTNATSFASLETSTSQPEVFRRIIFLPLAKPSSPAASESTEGSWNQ